MGEDLNIRLEYNLTEINLNLKESPKKRERESPVVNSFWPLYYRNPPQMRFDFPENGR